MKCLIACTSYLKKEQNEYKEKYRLKSDDGYLYGEKRIEKGANKVSTLTPLHFLKRKDPENNGAKNE